MKSSERIIRMKCPSHKRGIHKEVNPEKIQFSPPDFIHYLTEKLKFIKVTLY